jgi:hypothetical protein
MKRWLFIAAAVVSLLVPGMAAAEPARGELAGLVGWGTAAFNSTENNFGPGIGVRGGVAYRRLWVGATATYQFGQTIAYGDLDSSGVATSGDYALSVFAVGAELGVNLRIQQFVLRPYLWAGALVYEQSPLSSYTSYTAPEAPIVRFSAAPAVHFDYELSPSGVFFGADVRVNLLVPGTAPKVERRDSTYAVTSWTNQERFTGELSVFAVVGKRF